MLISMDKKKFDSLSIEAVGHICFSPMIPVYQSAMRKQSGSKPQEIRSQFYQTLSQGQRALFMFFSYYDHAIQSQDEFERIGYSYLSSNIFSVVKKGMEYFHDTEMLALFQMIERALLEKEQNKISELYCQLREISPCTLEKIGTYIKANPAEFICFE